MAKLVLYLLTLLHADLYGPAYSAGTFGGTARLYNHLESGFSAKRSHYHPEEKQRVRGYIRDFFSSLPECDAVLWEDEYVVEWGTDKHYDGVNFVYIIRGSENGTDNDRFTMASAHYDSVRGSPGVNDDGSAMSALLESTRALCSLQKCQRKKTTVIIAFDWEEQGLIGSEEFIDRLRTQGLLQTTKALDEQLEGVINMDTIMNWDDQDQSQTLPDGMNVLFPELYSEIKADNFKGNFLFICARQDDKKLAEKFVKVWNSLPQNDTMKVRLGVMPFSGLPSSLNKIEFEMYSHFMRSDHYNFWNYTGTSASLDQGLKGLFLTDTAEFRGSMVQCYHKECDNLSSVTDDKLRFLDHITDTLARFLVEHATDLPHAECVAPSGFYTRILD
ncbi:hypothetical protein CAPTEDRAFT_187588 [Capitella teleta]|uniref:Peptidase M28 domain-containing protein n=1 Tax=Capitella teleta TaxID=283909 RepID=R7UDR3_CAPTE|nr:hypothetical protein CAPTEDRAFT_187588 [Capitella teleta]|eukprot:ELU04129.1 hypothetical protein CAPTEDRAFT_187588 [Capitella teleta]